MRTLVLSVTPQAIDLHPFSERESYSRSPASSVIMTNWNSGRIQDLEEYATSCETGIYSCEIANANAANGRARVTAARSYFTVFYS